MYVNEGTFNRLKETAANAIVERDQLKTENAKLRELARDIWNQARLLDANKHIDGLRVTNERYEELKSRMRDCGVSV